MSRVYMSDSIFKKWLDLINRFHWKKTIKKNYRRQGSLVVGDVWLRVWRFGALSLKLKIRSLSKALRKMTSPSLLGNESPMSHSLCIKVSAKHQNSNYRILHFQKHNKVVLVCLLYCYSLCRSPTIVLFSSSHNSSGGMWLRRLSGLTGNQNGC